MTLDRLTEQFLAGQVVSADLTVAERDAIHLYLLARALQHIAQTTYPHRPLVPVLSQGVTHAA